MADQYSPSAQNWFERNPKEAIALGRCMFPLAATYGAEKLLAHINHSHKNSFLNFLVQRLPLKCLNNKSLQS